MRKVPPSGTAELVMSHQLTLPIPIALAWPWSSLHLDMLSYGTGYQPTQPPAITSIMNPGPKCGAVGLYTVSLLLAMCAASAPYTESDAI